MTAEVDPLNPPDPISLYALKLKASTFTKKGKDPTETTEVPMDKKKTMTGDAKPGVTRRQMLKLAAGGVAGFTFLQQRSSAAPIASERFLDALAVERIADRDPDLRVPIYIDLQ